MALSEYGPEGLTQRSKLRRLQIQYRLEEMVGAREGTRHVRPNLRRWRPFLLRRRARIILPS